MKYTFNPQPATRDWLLARRCMSGIKYSGIRARLLWSIPIGARSFSESEIREAIRERAAELEHAGCQVCNVANEDALCRLTAAEIAKGRVVGWFQGRMEWGPRALGNRSILCDPRRADMRDILNLKIKRREPFRPFAPSILEEAAGDYFRQSQPSPFMLMAHDVRPEKRCQIPATTHVDGTGRLQTVNEHQNPRFYKLIREFGRQTRVPVLLNTSFNENEPIVCRPQEALDCFLRTKMDLLVLGNFVIRRERPAQSFPDSLNAFRFPRIFRRVACIISTQARTYSMATMLVTGSSGLIGSEVVSYFSKLGWSGAWRRQQYARGSFRARRATPPGTAAGSSRLAPNSFITRSIFAIARCARICSRRSSPMWWCMRRRSRVTISRRCARSTISKSTRAALSTCSSRIGGRAVTAFLCT